MAPGPHPARQPHICGPELFFLHYVFWLGQHVYTGTCLHVNDTQTAGSLTAVSATFNFHFRLRSSSHIHIFAGCRSLDCPKMACSKFTAKRKVDGENRQFKKEWTEKCAFILPPTSTRPMCLICQETIAVMKISNLKRHYEAKYRNFEETFPLNSEVRTTKFYTLKSS